MWYMPILCRVIKGFKKHLADLDWNVRSVAEQPPKLKKSIDSPIMNLPDRNVIKQYLCTSVLGVLALGAGLTARADYPTTVLSDGPFAYFRLNETYTTLPDLATNLGTIGTDGTGSYVGTVSQGVAGALLG